MPDTYLDPIALELWREAGAARGSARRTRSEERALRPGENRPRRVDSGEALDGQFLQHTALSPLKALGERSGELPVGMIVSIDRCDYRVLGYGVAPVRQVVANKTEHKKNSNHALIEITEGIVMLLVEIFGQATYQTRQFKAAI